MEENPFGDALGYVVVRLEPFPSNPPVSSEVPAFSHFLRQATMCLTNKEDSRNVIVDGGVRFVGAAALKPYVVGGKKCISKLKRDPFYWNSLADKPIHGIMLPDEAKRNGKDVVSQATIYACGFLCACSLLSWPFKQQPAQTPGLPSWWSYCFPFV